MKILRNNGYGVLLAPDGNEVSKRVRARFHSTLDVAGIIHLACDNAISMEVLGHDHWDCNLRFLAVKTGLGPIYLKAIDNVYAVGGDTITVSVTEIYPVLSGHQ